MTKTSGFPNKDFAKSTLTLSLGSISVIFSECRDSFTPKFDNREAALLSAFQPSISSNLTCKDPILSAFSSE